MECGKVPEMHLMILQMTNKSKARRQKTPTPVPKHLLRSSITSVVKTEVSSNILVLSSAENGSPLQMNLIPLFCTG